MWIDKYLQLYIKNCPHYIWIFDFTNYIVENSQFYQSWNKCSGTSWKIWICRLKQEESCQVGDNSYLDIHGVLASASGTTQICHIIYLYISILKHGVMILVNCNSSAKKFRQQAKTEICYFMTRRFYKLVFFFQVMLLGTSLGAFRFSVTKVSLQVFLKTFTPLCHTFSCQVSS